MSQNSNIEVRPVGGKKGIAQFIDFRSELYMNHKYDVPYLRMDEVETLTPEKNSSFKFCEAQYFMAYRDGKAVGRVAAIINRNANETWGTKAVRFGWFDFVDDVEVSRALLDAVAAWGKERGMNQLIGPLGFTDMDREGMLVEGFEELSVMASTYNYEYYPEHIEKIGGFEKDNDWVMQKINIPEEVPAKISKTAALIEKRYNLKTYKPTKKELVQGGMAQKIFEVLNECYAHLYQFSQLSQDQIDLYVNNYIKMADMNLISVVLDGNDNDKLIGFGISFPSFSEALQKTKNGKLFPFGWWHLAKVLLWHKTDYVDLYLVGVKPEYRSKGANALIFNDLTTQFINYGFKYAIGLPQMETNDKVQSQWDYYDYKVHRRLRTFKKSI